MMTVYYLRAYTLKKKFLLSPLILQAEVLI